MAQFHHHPDNLIIIRTIIGIYMDTPQNFAVDLGADYPGLPDGSRERLYEPGVRHFLDNEPKDLAWHPGDEYIAAVSTLLAAQKARQDYPTKIASKRAKWPDLLKNELTAGGFLDDVKET